MNDSEWRKASTDEKLDWLRHTLNALVHHVDGPIREKFTELARRVDTVKKPLAEQLIPPTKREVAGKTD